jgi:Flp pilus assembly protein TadG
VAVWAVRKVIRLLARAVARFSVAHDAATAVEFALIAPAFIALLVAIFQVAVFLFAQQALQNAAMEAGRLLMTGQAQSDTQTQFKTTVCNNFLPAKLFSCNSLIVIVQNYSSFAAANTGAPALYNNGALITSWPYNPGAQGDVVVVQLIYPWSVVTGPLGFAMSTLPNGAAEMMGVTAFRVEPY